MKISPKVPSFLVAAALVVLGMGGAGVVQARDQRGDNVFWSVTVASPGVQVGVANARPVVAPVPVYPVYQQLAPVYVQSAPTYVQPAVYVQPAPVYVNQPQIVQAGWVEPVHHHGWWHGHRRHHERWEHDGYERHGGGYAQPGRHH